MTRFTRSSLTSSPCSSVSSDSTQLLSSAASANTVSPLSSSSSISSSSTLSSSSHSSLARVRSAKRCLFPTSDADSNKRFRFCPPSSIACLKSPLVSPPPVSPAPSPLTTRANSNNSISTVQSLTKHHAKQSPKHALNSCLSNQSASPPCSPKSASSIPISSCGVDSPPVEYDESLIVSSAGEQLEALYDALHLSHVPHVLPCRESQHVVLERFLVDRLQRCAADSMYVCGSPGTGKTASVDLVMWRLFGMRICTNRQLEIKYDPNANSNMFTAAICKASQSHIPDAMILSVNAMCLLKPSDLFIHLYASYLYASNELSCDDSWRQQPFVARELLEEVILNKAHSKHNKHTQTMIIIVIDEIDALLSKSHSILDHLFQWCTSSSSRLLLFGISNSVNLHNNFLSRLSSYHINPQKLIFPTYTVQDLVTIMTHRVMSIYPTKQGHGAACIQSGPPVRRRGRPSKSNSFVQVPSSTHASPSPVLPSTPSHPFFDANSLQILAQKVSKGRGDLRQCLEICRACVDGLQMELQAKLQAHTHNQQQQSANRLQVSLPFMFRMIQACMGSANDLSSKLSCLPAHQIIVLCIACIICHYQGGKETIAQFPVHYSSFCKHFDLPHPGSVDLNELLNALESAGLLKRVEHKRGRPSKQGNNNQHASYIQVNVRLEQLMEIFQANEQEHAASSTSACNNTYSHAFFARLLQQGKFIVSKQLAHQQVLQEHREQEAHMLDSSWS